MRAIKFRVFDTVTENVLSHEELLFCPEDFVNIVLLGIKPDQFKIMQYTGIKDKAGIEIYECDEIVFPDETSCIVKYENGAFICVANEDYDTTNRLLYANKHGYVNCFRWKHVTTPSCEHGAKER